MDSQMYQNKFNEIIEKIKIYHNVHPEIRFDQLLFIASRMGGWMSDDVFYCPDDVVLKGINKMLREL